MIETQQAQLEVCRVRHEEMFGRMTIAEEKVKALERVIEAQAVEIAKLKTVPMKYRRMEFNAQLQNTIESQAKVIEAAERLRKSLDCITCRTPTDTAYLERALAEFDKAKQS